MHEDKRTIVKMVLTIVKMLLIDNHRGFPLLVSYLPPHRRKQKKRIRIRERRTDRREEATTPRPLAHLPATPSPPLWIRQSYCRPCSATSRNTLTRQGRKANPPPPATANDQHTNKAKTKKIGVPACRNPQPHATDTRASRGCPLQERARSKNPHHRNSGGLNKQTMKTQS